MPVQRELHGCDVPTAAAVRVVAVSERRGVQRARRGPLPLHLQGRLLGP